MSTSTMLHICKLLAKHALLYISSQYINTNDTHSGTNISFRAIKFIPILLVGDGEDEATIAEEVVSIAAVVLILEAVVALMADVVVIMEVDIRVAFPSVNEHKFKL